jgi:hypothetical protein
MKTNGIKIFVDVFIVIVDNIVELNGMMSIERWKVVPDNDWFGRTKGVSYIKKTDSELELNYKSVK